MWSPVEAQPVSLNPSVISQTISPQTTGCNLQRLNKVVAQLCKERPHAEAGLQVQAGVGQVHQTATHRLVSSLQLGSNPPSELGIKPISSRDWPTCSSSHLSRVPGHRPQLLGNICAMQQKHRRLHVSRQTAKQLRTSWPAVPSTAPADSTCTLHRVVLRYAAGDEMMPVQVAPELQYYPLLIPVPHLCKQPSQSLHPRQPLARIGIPLVRDGVPASSQGSTGAHN